MNFPSVTLQGNILTFDILEQIAQGEAAKQAPRDYGATNKEELRNRIQDAWVDANDFYQTFSRGLERLNEGDTGTTLTRDKWISPLLSSLGYEMMRYTQGQIINERNYFISHHAVNLQEFPVHIVGANRSLDRKGSGMRMSPHALVQEYLNGHENLYAIVTNGRILRLLRDSSLLTRLSYVEFDLVKIFEENLYPDFALLYRLLHQSRMPLAPEEGDGSIIEQYHLDGLASGSRIRDKLSIAVEEGILKMATGLLKEPVNEDLRAWVQQESNSAADYYEHLLKLIYRLLFIMVIEERDLIFPKPLDEVNLDEKRRLQRQQRIYYEYYSIGRLRQLSLQYQLANEKHYDLWENLINTFQLFEPGPTGTKLGIAPLAGDLFTAQALGPLYSCRLNNRALLETLRGLSQFDNEQGQPITVNYGALDVEEFGSIYEGLLEYAPFIDTGDWAFTFVKGDDRSSSGSHYTPDALVQPLIKHSLEHLIQDRIVSPEAPQAEREAAIQKLLQLTVCDVACGSGHILLAAARRIGLAVARLRTQEEQPNPTAVRQGVRDTILYCIYGVDKNPLAVELCKVALWLEAHVPGQPLNFLDHKIKNGDAIVGVGHLEDLQKGIPTEAFKAVRDEEKELCKLLRKANKAERQSREGGQLFTSSMIDSVTDRLQKYREKFAVFRAMPEQTVAEIEAKRAAYRKLTSGTNWWFVYNLANLQLAPFFVLKDDANKVLTDAQYFEVMEGRKKYPQAESLALAEATERKFFHWFLEFPEVFSGGGFNCVLGNPPYLGDKKLGRSFDKNYLNFLPSYYPEAGLVDIVTYFLRRYSTIISPTGFITFITTNSIAQGDTRVSGLYFLQEKGLAIHYASTNISWPGTANVTVSIVGLTKREVEIHHLDGVLVDYISSSLDDLRINPIPHKFRGRGDLAFVGVYPNGKGFTISRDQFAAFLYSDKRNNEVLSEYMNAQILNNSYNLISHKYIINFRNYNRETAESYIEPFNWLVEYVKPYRDKLIKKGGQIHEYNFWLHWDRREEKFLGLQNNKRILVVGRTSKTLAFEYIRPEQLPSDSLVIFKDESYANFSNLQSSLHNAWVWKHCTTMKTDPVYGPSNVFQNYPFPPESDLNKHYELELIGNQYHESRSQLMTAIQLGLTKTYNQLHNAQLVTDYDTYFGESQPFKGNELKKKLNKETWNLYNHLQKIKSTISLGEVMERIIDLRRLHKEMDEAVLAAYGWDVDTRRWGKAIRLRHDFYEVDYLPEKDRVRYTIHPEARREVLKRLLLLNHEIHEAEERGVPYEVIDGEKVVALMREQVEVWLPQTESLHPNTLRFLCSGEDLLPNLERSLVKSYKPFVTQYSSAIENELQHKLFVAFNEHFHTVLYPETEARDAFLQEQMTLEPKLNLLAKHLKQGNVKYTLGNMHFIMNLLYKPSGSTLAKCKVLQQLRAFILTVYDESLLTKAFMKELDAFIQAYRNEAAHTGEVNKAMAEACRDEVRRMMGVLVEKEKN